MSAKALHTEHRVEQLERGAARCPDEPTTQEIIDKDKMAAPTWVRSESYQFLGDEDISTDRYYDAEFARKEYEHLWTRTWQFACREEHIAEVGDYYVYDIGRQSFIITRVGENDIRAYYNACLHRGTKLRASGTDGCTQEFKCPFHGWTWNLDGSLQKAVCQWDFPHVDAEKFSLPEAKVECLAGFVFINMDHKAAALKEYFGPEFMQHISEWGLEDRHITCHVSKKIPANWKLTMEAFMEAYHVIETHPQVAVSNADANSQYDIYGEHVNRFISPLGVLSPHLKGQYSEQEILDQFTVGDASVLGDVDRTLAEGETARQRMADTMRSMFEQATQTDLSNVSDSELLDCFSYTLFPNTFVFPGISLPMVYRFRPDPNDHRATLYEVFFLRPVPKHGKRPLPAEPVHLQPHQSFTEAEGMDEGFGVILDQDTENLLLQQQGIEASAKPGLTLANYQEIRVRHFEMAIDSYVSRK
jgi:phenylpropionate dioxygenase-like ring-hydroxylating dioxygenase large terminal subunit